MTRAFGYIKKKTYILETHTEINTDAVGWFRFVTK